MYPIHYGYKAFDNLNAVVTSGVGGWGTPIRVGSDTEVVSINLKFK